MLLCSPMTSTRVPPPEPFEALAIGCKVCCRCADAAPPRHRSIAELLLVNGDACSRKTDPLLPGRCTCSVIPTICADHHLCAEGRMPG